MRLNTTRIPCNDLKASTDYYASLFEMHQSFGTIEQGYVGFTLENVNILLELEEPGEFESGRYLGFSLEVEDIQDFYNRGQEKGITFTGQPDKQAWGGIMTHVEDCNGNVFTIVQANTNEGAE